MEDNNKNSEVIKEEEEEKNSSSFLNSNNNNRLEVFESDTIEAEEEEINHFLSSLFPSSSSSSTSTSLSNLISYYQQFSFSYNKKLFDGWVKQPSPCCAAASLAGCLNCLSNLNRKDKRSFNHSDILFIYENILKRSIQKKKQSFERCLGGQINEFLELLEEYILQYEEKNIKKKKGIGRITLIKLSKQIVIDKLQLSTQQTISSSISSSTSTSGLSTYELLKELIDLETSTQNEENDLIDKEVRIYFLSRKSLIYSPYNLLFLLGRE